MHSAAGVQERDEQGPLSERLRGKELTIVAIEEQQSLSQAKKQLLRKSQEIPRHSHEIPGNPKEIPRDPKTFP